LLEQNQSHTRTHVVILDSPRDVGQLAALLAQFDAFLCHDSGPMHVAAAVGTPVVALFVHKTRRFGVRSACVT
jgi:ADP-heptose:LPS heptosyltransferase